VTITRRRALRSSGLLALGAAVWPQWMPRLVFGRADQAPAGDTLVVVFARGGYDGLNMIIPYGNEGYYFARRPTIGIPAPDDRRAARRGVDLDGFFGMHPTLVDRGWKELFDGGNFAVVHAMHMDDTTRSHFDAMDYMERGTPGKKSVQTGWLGRHLQTMAHRNESPFRAVGMGTMVQPSLRGPVPAVALQSIADFHLQGRQSEVLRFQQHLEQLYAGDGWLDREGQSTFAAVAMLAERIGNQPYVPANGADYGPAGAFGQGLQQIARLIKADMGLEVACVDIGGWDTHANQADAADPTAGTMANLMSALAGGITAFVKDLWPSFDPTDRTARGVTLMVMSEFGRRAHENGGVGTDHGHGNTMFLFGKGIVGGQVYVRPWPGLADDELDRGDLAGTTEYRDVLGEILERRVGNPAVPQVFPGWQLDYLGLARPLAAPPPAPTVQPTAGPTEAPTAEPTGMPTGVPTEPPPGRRGLYLPWTRRGGV